MNKLVEAALDVAERAGMSVSVHPTKTVLIRNLAETLVLYPREGQSVQWEIRELFTNLCGVGNTAEEAELIKLVRELK